MRPPAPEPPAGDPQRALEKELAMRSATILIVLSATSVNFASQPGAMNHTANFAGQSGWSSESSASPAAGSNYDRYGQPTGASGSTVGPPPSITSRAQQAFNETGTTLRDGVDAGIRAANEQLQNVGNNLKTSAEQTFGRYNDQLQPISPIGTTTSSPTSTTTSRAKNGVSPPPWSTSSSTAPNSNSSSAPSSTGQSVDRTFAPGMVPTRTETGWTSIGSGVAAPPLLIPPLPPTPVATQSRLAAGSNGPTFPSILDAQKADGPQSRSLLVNSPDQPASRSTANDWASGWNNNNNVNNNNSNNADTGATISRSNNNTTNLNSQARTSDLVAVDRSSVNANSQDNRSRQTGTNWDDPWGGADSWSGQNSQRSGAGGSQAPGISAAQQSPGISAGGSLAANSPAQPQPAPATGSPANTASVPPAAAPASSNVTLPQQNPAAQAAASAHPQWMTLAVVLLSLVGSLSANVFLGMSYMDARQKYQSLVRRTADSFRRVPVAAA
jgi:hypothetical protein